MNMNVTLYEAANRVSALLDEVDEDGCYPEETLQALELVEKKSEAVVAYILNCEAEADMIADAAKRMAERAKPLKNRSTRLREYLAMNMKRTGITEIKSPELYAKLELERDSSVEVFDDKQLPGDYINIKEVWTPDKKAIAAAIKAGAEIPGARIVKNDRLTIK